jgi:hypothetical protein
VSALERIAARSQLATGFVAPRSGDVTVAAAGLARMRRLVDALGNPQRAYKTIHVAGSKGKGSTVACAAAILTATGRKTGRYTSPHLMDWRERIAVDGVDISAPDFDRVVDYVDSRWSGWRPGAPTTAPQRLRAADRRRLRPLSPRSAARPRGRGRHRRPLRLDERDRLRGRRSSPQSRPNISTSWGRR